MPEMMLPTVAAAATTTGANTLDVSTVTTATTTCQGCSLPIKDQYIFKVLPDMQWHEHCLKCAECNCHLTETCFIRNSRAYCRQDYFNQFQCAKCALPLARTDLVIKSKERMFHMDCFKCAICVRKLAPGEEYCHQEESNMLYCKDDVHMGSGMIVQASSSPKFLSHNHQLYLTTNQRYSNQQSSSMAITPENSNSFSPSTTSSSSSSSSSSSVTDSPSNNHSYNMMNSSFPSSQLNYSSLVDNMPNSNNGVVLTGCAGNQGLGPNVNANRYNFNQGNSNSNNNNADNSDAESDDDDQDNEDSEDDDENLIDDNDQSLTDDETSFSEKKKRAKKSCNKAHGLGYKSSPDSLLMQINQNNNSHSQQYSHNGASNGGGGSGNKPARIRTVLNEKQLHTLRACYGANPRPDALMKEQLVEMTGLNPRVIRVWFQNKRCKDKKKNMLRPPGDVHIQQHGGYQQQQHQQFNPMAVNPHPSSLQQQQQQQYSNSHLMFDHCF